MILMLGWLRNHCSATLALHLLLNPLQRELYIFPFGISPESEKMYQAELFRIHDLNTESLPPRSRLPDHWKKTFPAGKTDKLFRLLSWKDQVRTVPVTPRHPLKGLFRELSKKFPDEFPSTFEAADGAITLIPLGTGVYPHLGCFVLWAPKQADSPKDSRRTANLTAFRKTIEKLIIKVFSNYYNMEPTTCLPIHCQAGGKKVALLCAEINGFDLFSEALLIREDFTSDQKSSCISSLVNFFAETAGMAVSDSGGRVDRNWGSGFLAVFGENRTNDNISCMEALEAASVLVNKFRIKVSEWLTKDFQLDKFKNQRSQHISLDVTIGVDYGTAIFEYVGSTNHRVYMALGDKVDFVSQLAKSLRPPCPRNKSAKKSTLFGAKYFHDAPIVVSEAVISSVRDIITDKPEQSSIKIRLSGRNITFDVYKLRPDNIVVER
jgi:class 3 adenylate cyclase